MKCTVLGVFTFFGSKRSGLLYPKLVCINPYYLLHKWQLLNVPTKPFKLNTPEAPQILRRRMTLGHSQTPVTMTFSVRVLHSCVTINF
ncbi:rCG55221 [Rattus norvegicus]|uniref:RCG55221 n=1 Tax=Rattus norvegicus TaxID=10116 RepID=A6J841_RAT|nr:rCG55221 [Rattus norvegicus]